MASDVEVVQMRRAFAGYHFFSLFFVALTLLAHLPNTSANHFAATGRGEDLAVLLALPQNISS